LIGAAIFPVAHIQLVSRGVAAGVLTGAAAIAGVPDFLASAVRDFATGAGVSFPINCSQWDR
jgi:hypothetical protein